jgi:UDP-N-acetylmuramyl pentapeptide synthase
MGPGVNTCAEAFNISAKQVRELVANWNDSRGHMECVRAQDSYWRIDAYYNAG